ncbi:CLUMA_CG003049, isoform A [Clunio marinus]|uniref:CLUMA_CG003049, isoform A n=1 Tax=Clunio marinus TaxID=568069 RepID=A0A1J1HP31_9DIPT|nr:CLUMA_CG003049, isoform A [Clunio marinus]
MTTIFYDYDGEMFHCLTTKCLKFHSRYSLHYENNSVMCHTPWCRTPLVKEQTAESDGLESNINEANDRELISTLPLKDKKI